MKKSFPPGILCLTVFLCPINARRHWHLWCLRASCQAFKEFCVVERLSIPWGYSTVDLGGLSSGRPLPCSGVIALSMQLQQEERSISRGRCLLRSFACCSGPDPGVDTKSLVLGMTGMSLVANYSDRVRRETESTLDSTSPNDSEVISLGLHHHHHHLPPPPPPVEPPLRGSAPPSPSSDRQAFKGVSRPPGMSVSTAGVPSPIGKVGPGHSKNTSATSPLLTLTPNSSVDGTDWHSLGARQSPSFQGADAPALPFLHSEHRRRDHEGFGSFDLADGDNDGLLGLEALRDRANSSPGPIQILSTSPPVGVAPRGPFPPHLGSNYGIPHDAAAAEKPRPRDRPPLSHSYQEGMGTASGMGFVSVSSNRSVGSDPNNLSMESADSRGFGAIGRPPDLRQMMPAEYDPNRRRAASSGDGFHGQPYVLQNAVPEPLISHKFGTLPTLSAHIQQQRMPEGIAAELQRPRHVRSVSQPMPNNGYPQYNSAPTLDSRYNNHSAIQLEGHSYSGETRYKQVASNPAMSSLFEGNNQYGSQKRASLPSMGNIPGYAPQQPMYQHSAPRRENVEYQYHGSPHGSVAGADDIRSYPSMISPGHSPLQVHYGGSHSRHNSDAGSTMMLSSSPRSIGAGSLPGNMMHRRQLSGGGGGDDDLAHPLIGEHIDVPAEHDDMYAMGNAYSLAQPSIQRHGHSLSMGELPPQYVDASHLLPTAGSALPMPKVVYSIKFKRTQRNFVLGPRINRDLKIGTYVKVEADRGEDLGIVVGKLPADKYSFSRSSFTAGMNPGLGGGAADLKRIIRLATHDEVSLLSMKRDEEEELLKICRTKVRQRGLPMHVVDAEYQFDRHKLTFFFEAEGRVDFRELVRDLFSMYKTRIWMQQLDKNTSTSAPAMMAPHPSSLQMDYGTPIIAPVSEFADSIVLGGMSLGDARSH